MSDSIQIDQLEKLLDKDGIVFLTYGGVLTHSLIVGMTEALEHETENNDMNLSVSTNLMTIFIELSQNMMNYSKHVSKEKDKFDPKGMILVGFNKDSDEYYVLSRNLVGQDDRTKLAPMLENLSNLNKDDIKVLYRKLRKSGKGKHDKGAGIGFLEIAKRCDRFDYQFTSVNKQYLYFIFKSYIKNR